MESKIVAFDPGFQFTKGYSEHGKYMCLARVAEVEQHSGEPQEGITILEFEGSKFQVGDGLNVLPELSHDKTQSPKTKVELLNYLHQICEGEKGSFVVITGTPLSKNQTESGLKQQLMSYLETNSQYIEVKRNGITKGIKVDKVISMPQAMITYYNLPVEERSRYKSNNSSVLIWDLGGHTFDVAEFIGGNPQTIPDTKLYTRNTGIIPMLIKFRKKLDYKYPALDFPSTEELRKIFERKYFPTPDGTEDVSEIVEATGREHVQELIQDMSMVFKPATADENLLCGGGFVTLAPFVQEIFPRARLIEDAQFSNVKAMYAVAANQIVYNRIMGDSVPAAGCM